MDRFIKQPRGTTLSIGVLALVLALTGSARGSIPPRALHYVAVGVSQNPGLPPDKQLRCAHKDAQDLARIWRAQEGKLYSQTDGVTLTDQHATRDNILAALDGLIVRARSGDTAMICLCGHGGFCGFRGEWGFLPYDYDDAGGGNTGLSGTTLRAKLTQLARRGITVVLALDCCHAGAFGIQNSDFVVFAACLPQEVSRENPVWNNGLFTKALIEALQGKADFNGDGTVSLAEVDAYVSSRVAELLRAGANPFGANPPEQNPSCGRPTSIRSSLPLARVGKSRRSKKVLVTAQ